MSEGNSGEPFKKFIRKVAAWAKDPKNTVLVMDNASYHRNKALKQLCKDRGLGLLYLPPCSSKY